MTPLDREGTSCASQPEEAIKVRAYLQRNPGCTTVRLWFISKERPSLGWFHEMDFDKVLREEIANKTGEDGNRSWSAFEASFFGPQLQELEALSSDYDERLLDQQLTRGTPPALPEPEPEADSVSRWRVQESLDEAVLV